MAYTTIVAGTTITAAWANASVRDQSVSVFADSTARDSAIASPVAGMVAALTTPDNWVLYDGTGWSILTEPRQAWTPTISWTLGNGTFVAGYQRHDGLCTFDAAFTFGTTSAIAGTATAGLPVATLGIPAAAINCGFTDTGTDFFTGTSAAVAAAGTTVALRVIDCASTYARFANTSGTIPFTWTTGDIVSWSGTFRMNTRYL